MIDQKDERVVDRLALDEMIVVQDEDKRAYVCVADPWRALGDVVDHRVGISVFRKTSDQVDVGDVLCLVHAATEDSAERVVGELQRCFQVSEEQVNARQLVDSVMPGL